MFYRLLTRIRPTPVQTDWEDYFAEDEHLLWSAAPVADIRFHPALIFLSIFGVPFLMAGLGVSFMGLIQVLSFKDLGSILFGIFMFFFGMPFIGVGGGLVFGTWLIAAIAPDCVRYALTNKRGYIAKSFWRQSMESYPITADAALKIEQGRKSDTVTFAVKVGTDSDGDSTTKPVSFEHIANGAEVYALLRDIQSRLTD